MYKGTIEEQTNFQTSKIQSNKSFKSNDCLDFDNSTCSEDINKSIDEELGIFWIFKC